ncbi:unnamed protein product [Lampetra fluviatilis]
MRERSEVVIAGRVGGTARLGFHSGKETTWYLLSRRRRVGMGRSSDAALSVQWNKGERMFARTGSPDDWCQFECAADDATHDLIQLCIEQFGVRAPGPGSSEQYFATE